MTKLSTTHFCPFDTTGNIDCLPNCALALVSECDIEDGQIERWMCGLVARSNTVHILTGGALYPQSVKSN